MMAIMTDATVTAMTMMIEDMIAMMTDTNVIINAGNINNDKTVLNANVAKQIEIARDMLNGNARTANKNDNTLKLSANRSPINVIKTGNRKSVSKSVNGLKIDVNNPTMIVSNVPMINAAIKTKVGITHVKNEKIVIVHQTNEIAWLSSLSDLPSKKDLHGIQ